jgi:hypothetical protein
MARYFFNVHDGSDYLDTVGTKLLGLTAVHEEAVRTAGEMLRDGGREDLWSGEQWRMIVTDESGLEVLTLTFSASQPGFQPLRRS